MIRWQVSGAETSTGLINGQASRSSGGSGMVVREAPYSGIGPSPTALGARGREWCQKRHHDPGSPRKDVGSECSRKWGAGTRLGLLLVADQVPSGGAGACASFKTSGRRVAFEQVEMGWSECWDDRRTAARRRGDSNEGKGAVRLRIVKSPDGTPVHPGWSATKEEPGGGPPGSMA